LKILKGKGILTTFQKNLLVDLGEIKDVSFFYLTGETALAEFYFAHRRSNDLDFFTSEKDLIIPFSTVIEEKLSRKGYTLKSIRRFESFLEIEVSKKGETVQLHFAYDSPFRFDEPHLSEFGVKINDYQDLIVDKLLTFFGRWKHRDAIDLFFILRNEPLETLLERAKEKDPGFDLYWFSASLKEVDEYPDVIEQWPVEMLVEVSVKDLKTKFLSLARELLGKIKKE